MMKAEHLRLVTWRLKILRHAADEQRTVAQTCRCFGISRKTPVLEPYITAGIASRLRRSH